MKIDRQTEIRRLSSVLYKNSSELAYLKPLSGEALQSLRESLQNKMLDEFGGLFAKMASGGKIAPDKLSAILCKKVFGPTLTANMSYYTPAGKAADMCKHLDDEFMANIAREQIPERAVPLLEGLPVAMMRSVTRQLLASKDYYTMGGFTDHMPEEKTRELMQEISDPADNLRVSCYAQRKDRIATLASKLPDAELKALITAAFSSEEFIREVGLVTAAMTDSDQQRMAKLSDELDTNYRPQARQLAEAEGLSQELTAYFSA